MRVLGVGLALAMALGCRGPEASPAPAPAGGTLASGSEQPSPARLLEVLVARRADGAIRILDVTEAPMPSIGVPTPGWGGSLRVAALDEAGTPRDIQPLRLEASLEHTETRAVVYVGWSEGVAQVAVGTPDGEVLDATRVPPLPVQRAKQAAAGPCDHVRILMDTTADEQTVAPFVLWYKDLRNTTPTAARAVREALSRMPPFLCQGVGRVGFYRECRQRSDLTRVDDHVVAPGPAYPGVCSGDHWQRDPWRRQGGGVNAADPSTILMNADLDADGVRWSEVGLQRPEAYAMLVGAIVHEAAHATSRLLEHRRASGAPDRQPNRWSPQDHRAARDRMTRLRFEESGFLGEWDRVHEAFQALGWARDYGTFNDEPRSTAAAEDLAAAGFMSVYGNLNPFEGIAEFVRWPITRDLYRSAGVQEGMGLSQTADGACLAIRARGGQGINAQTAAVYTKLVFVRQLGLISQADFDRCVGPGAWRGAQGDGFTVHDGDSVNHFGDHIRHRFGVERGHHVFIMEADGTATFGSSTNPSTLRLTLQIAPFASPRDLPPWPRGVYVLGEHAPNRLEFRMPANRYANFDARQGAVALITEASDEAIVGSIHVPQGWRLHAAVPVPQVFDPPLRIPFRIPTAPAAP